MGALKDLFTPYADKIIEGGPGFLKGSARLCYVIINLESYPEDKEK